MIGNYGLLLSQASRLKTNYDSHYFYLGFYSPNCVSHPKMHLVIHFKVHPSCNSGSKDPGITQR